MRDRGLTPSAYSSGARPSPGRHPENRNTPALQALVVGALAFHYPANVSRPLQLRRENLPQGLQDISWKAQVQRCQPYRQLSARCKHANQVVVASAQQVPATPSIPYTHGFVERPKSFAVHRQRHCPGVVSPSTALRGSTSSSLKRGRQLTDAGQVVTNPRISAGSTVLSDGLCRCRWTA
jgi:hypothetical protein